MQELLALPKQKENEGFNDNKERSTLNQSKTTHATLLQPSKTAHGGLAVGDPPLAAHCRGAGK